jgi:hypothetical protein
MTKEELMQAKKKMTKEELKKMTKEELQKAKVLEDVLSAKNAKNVQVQREGERSAILLLCVAFSYVPRKVTTCSLLRVCVL